MHYIIQKTTRQHIAVADDMPCPVECVKVRADAEGWVKHSGPWCPVPLGAYVDVICNSGVEIGSVSEQCIDWNNIAKYRPLPDEIEEEDDPRADDLPATTAPGHELAAMLLSIICAFAIGVLIGWGWM